MQKILPPQNPRGKFGQTGKMLPSQSLGGKWGESCLPRIWGQVWPYRRNLAKLLLAWCIDLGSNCLFVAYYTYTDACKFSL